MLRHVECMKVVYLLDDIRHNGKIVMYATIRTRQRELSRLCCSEKGKLKRHIESKHFPNLFSYQCTDCSHVVGSRKALERHRERVHPKH